MSTSSFVLQNFASGDTTYISKLNSNNSAIQAAVTNLQSSTSGSSFVSSSIISLIQALFGSSSVLLGHNSCVSSTASNTFTLSAGTVWNPNTSTIVQIIAPVGLDFTSQAAGTYYIVLNSVGAPTIQTSSTGALYSVVWNAPGFGTITPLAIYFMTAAEEQALCHSTTNNTTYSTLLARLEAIETLLNTKT